jgi:tetratricopeptide (TPR) repeat protein
MLPTILEALQMPIPAGLRGRSLLDLSRGRPGADVVTYFEALSGQLNRGWAPLTGVITKREKYIDLPIPELYDLAADEKETNNLADGRAQRIDELRRVLGSFGGREVRRVDETPEVRERLRALGYVAANAPSSSKRYTEDDDPKRLIGVETKLQEVASAYLSGDVKDAVARSRALVEAYPDMRVALLQLAHVERETGNLPAAISALRHAVRINPGDAEAASLLAASLTAADQPVQAIEVLEPYTHQAAPETQVLMALALAQAKARRFADALGTLGRARAQDPLNAMLLVEIGTVELMWQRRSQARNAFEEALALNPDVARAHSSLGALAAEEGRTNDGLEHWRRAVALDAREYESLLAVSISLARSGRAADARPLFQLFVNGAPPSRYAADIAKARDWLDREPR